MKKFIGLMGLVFIGTVGWRVGESLSSDAVSMALGLLLGVMAGIPTALMVLAASRREGDYELHRRPLEKLESMGKIERHYHVHLHGDNGQGGGEGNTSRGGERGRLGSR